MQRPSGVNEWQQPAAEAIPTFPACGSLSTPEEVHAASNLAASASMASLSRVSMAATFYLKIERLFVYLDYHEWERSKEKFGTNVWLLKTAERM